MSSRSATWARSRHPPESNRSLLINPSPQFHQHVLNSVVTLLRSILNWIKETFQPSRKPVETVDEGEAKEFLDQWLISANRPLCKYSDQVPEWFDPEKFGRGQHFAMKNLLGLVYAEQLAVVLLLSLPMVRSALIFSGKTDSAEKAFRRYLSTVERVITWYSQDIWSKDSKAHHNLLVVRGMHDQAEQKMRCCSSVDRTAVEKQFDSKIPTPMQESVRADLASYLPNKQQLKWLEAFNSNRSQLFINQLGMACTQLGFVGLLVLAPGKFGASRASRADLDDFVYVWYVLGHQLGIDDRFNICAGGFEKTRRRCRHIMQHIMLPSLGLAGNDWSQMSLSLVEGVDKILHQLSFNASFSYFMWALNIPCPNIDSHISWSELPRIWLFKAVLCAILRVPGFPDFFSKLLLLRLRALRNRLNAANRETHLQVFS